MMHLSVSENSSFISYSSPDTMTATGDITTINLTQLFQGGSASQISRLMNIFGRLGTVAPDEVSPLPNIVYGCIPTQTDLIG